VYQSSGFLSSIEAHFILELTVGKHMVFIVAYYLKIQQVWQVASPSHAQICQELAL
jgi:hypothetical protein